MTRFVSDRLPPLASFALALLVASALNADLKAACGDYVQVGSHGPQQAAAPTNQRSQPPAPCHGPRCSRHQAPLTPSPAPITSHAGNDWFCLAAYSITLPDERVSRVESFDTNSLIETSFDVFRPPR